MEWQRCMWNWPKALELTPKKGPNAKWSDKGCDFCDTPPNDLVLEIRHRTSEGVGLNICPTCAAMLLRVVLSAYDGPRERLAVVLHELRSHWAQQMMPVMDELMSALPDTGERWVKRVGLAIKGWKAQAMAGFVDLHGVVQRECLEQADKMLAALGAEMPPVEVEYVGKMGVFTSARVRTDGDHDKVRIWNRGGLAGELVCKKGDGDTLMTRLGMWPKGAPLEEEAGRLRELRRGHEVGCTELTSATGEYVQALEDYVKKTIPDLDKE